VLAPPDTHLMSKGNELDFQGGGIGGAKATMQMTVVRIVIMPTTVRIWR